ncbi:hypothetical protein PPERSA_08691 [Pseudocohnilembus persalinus]|uniref:RING-type E3 ubiquitin transferase n=1 Tax=Pseudocohnilembus persalinus TaxID=266149 RepID=A0A0V0R912_PSEPJ|nr:hypothetical protein PPERSA_08691 [Pseudocohnilembus persalinus]|eukprot:KRX10696.1 hypothetical protein PPERSA_08691 [Pseudocohnilembus persalinus]
MQQESQQNYNQDKNYQKLQKFLCKICLEIASEPVITDCGHLYCWECLYQWAQNLKQKHRDQICPQCKSQIDIDKVTTVYTDGEEQQNKENSNITHIVNQQTIGNLNQFTAISEYILGGFILIIRLKDIDEKIEKLKNQQESIEQSINDSMIDKEPSDERTEKLELLNKLKAEYDKSQKKINWYKRNDPERKEQLEQDQENLKVKTNHWIDQLFEVKKFLMNKGMSDDDIFNAFQIPADIDNI